MTDLETGYLIVGLLFFVSAMGMICITLDMFFNREEKHVVIKPRYEPIDIASFVSDDDEAEDEEHIIIDF